MTIRIALVDDHALLRNSLAQLLAGAPGLEVALAFADGESALGALKDQSVDVILMDIAMPGIGGIEATRRILKADPEARVIMLTSFAERSMVVQALSAGAIGYLLKDAEPEELVRAIHAAVSGESMLTPRVATTLVLELRGRREALANTTPREREVLRFIVAGLSNKQIARRMAIAEKTVKSHLTNTFAKIGVEDRTQAAVWAMENGIAGDCHTGQPAEAISRTVA